MDNEKVVNEYICAITEEGIQLKELIDEKVKALIRSVRVKEQKYIFNSHVRVKRLTTEMSKTKSSNRNIAENKYGSQGNLDIDPTGKENPISSMAFVQYTKKMAIETVIEKQFAELIFGDKPTLHNFGCFRCQSIKQYTDKPGDLLKRYIFRCGKCSTEIVSSELPLECYTPEYRFRCQTCGLDRITRTKPPKMENGQYSYTCSCTRMLFSFDNPILTAYYQYYCTGCKKDVTTTQKPLIKETWQFDESDAVCGECGELFLEFLGDVE